MVFFKQDRSRRVLRALKTLFYLITMLLSLLLFSAPLLLVIADALLPSALLSAISPSPSPLSLQTLSSHFHRYDFRHSLLDIPLVSIIRSFLIFCVYSSCDGPRLSRGPYLGVTTACSVLSAIFVSWKAVYVFRRTNGRALEMALFVCSYALAVGHIVVAYRTSCRERRKLLVYKIDMEAHARTGIRGILRFCGRNDLNEAANRLSDPMKYRLNRGVFNLAYSHLGVSGISRHRWQLVYPTLKGIIKAKVRETRADTATIVHTHCTVIVSAVWALICHGSVLPIYKKANYIT